jgi:hypothetical protein
MSLRLSAAMVLLATLASAAIYAGPLPETNCVPNVFQEIYSGDLELINI